MKTDRINDEMATEKRKWKGKNLTRVFMKEATVTVDLGNVKYEVTLEREDDIEKLTDGLIFKGINCEVKRLHNWDYVVSFMLLPVYLDDEDTVHKLDGWGVIPVSKIKRRMYPGANIEDGTRFVKTRFPREVTSLPYSPKMETAEGPQYFRVMQSPGENLSPVHEPGACGEGLP
ncbi:hypothetical protein AMELA_G00177850 [Ameiurus melas]|uniref:Uncharacterized protein n=1 Tax=Ameiurus melas TaxID=219545 RepID=A0A7J6A985_AMEME|nr:hypothetical protein AMELA_G00177850 [Ameiurus melas]